MNINLLSLFYRTLVKHSVPFFYYRILLISINDKLIIINAYNFNNSIICLYVRCNYWSRTRNKLQIILNVSKILKRLVSRQYRTICTISSIFHDFKVFFFIKNLNNAILITTYNTFNKTVRRQVSQ